MRLYCFNLILRPSASGFVSAVNKSKQRARVVRVIAFAADLTRATPLSFLFPFFSHIYYISSPGTIAVVAVSAGCKYRYGMEASTLLQSHHRRFALQREQPGLRAVSSSCWTAENGIHRGASGNTRK